MKLFRKHSFGHGQKLYGPPEMLEERKKERLFTAKRNSAECIYGPPEMLEARRLGKPFPSPKENVAEDVYGPPEMFGGPPDEPDDGNKSEE